MKMKRVYKTAMGRELDIHQLGLINEKAIALGNANLNARGDQIDSRGKVIKKREELAQEYYRANPKAVRDNIEVSEDSNVLVGADPIVPITQPIKSVSGEDFDADITEQDSTRKAKKK